MRGLDLSRDLVEFAFESRASDDLDPAALARLVRQAWRNNLRAGLTGELRLEDGRFFQVVEGRCADVVRLAARILTDSRHCAIRTLALDALPARRYAAWTVSGFDLGGPLEEAPPLSVPDNVRFLRARAQARALELGRTAS